MVLLFFPPSGEGVVRWEREAAGPQGSFSCGLVSLLALTPHNTNKIDDNN